MKERKDKVGKNLRAELSRCRTQERGRNIDTQPPEATCNKTLSKDKDDSEYKTMMMNGTACDTSTKLDTGTQFKIYKNFDILSTW